MFDASFPEIVLILLVALIVIGPERLPRVARTIGLWVGRARSMFNSMRNEVEREIQMDELRKAERDLKKDLDLNRDVMEDVDKPKQSRKRKGGGTSPETGGRSETAGGSDPESAAETRQDRSGEDHGPRA